MNATPIVVRFTEAEASILLTLARATPVHDLHGSEARARDRALQKVTDALSERQHPPEVVSSWREPVRSPRERFADTPGRISER